MAKNRKKASKSQEDQGLKETKIQDKNPHQTTAQKSPAPPKTKPKTAAERRKDQIDGIKKTVYPSLLGVIAGFVCYYILGIGDQTPWLWLSAMMFVIAMTYFIQKLTYPFLGIDANEFQGKDWLYVEFIAIDLWLVTWTFLLN